MLECSTSAATTREALLLVHHFATSDAETWNEVHAGWLNVLFPLKAWVGFGVDLRNHDGGRTWDEGYADQ